VVVVCVCVWGGLLKGAMPSTSLTKRERPRVISGDLDKRNRKRSVCEHCIYGTELTTHLMKPF
jgi:hypothetical protein